MITKRAVLEEANRHIQNMSNDLAHTNFGKSLKNKVVIGVTLEGWDCTMYFDDGSELTSFGNIAWRLGKLNE